MKKNLLLFCLLSSFVFSTYAQNISKNVLNGGFENWPITSLGFTPDDYNESSVYDGQSGISRVSGVDAQNGTYAVRLETVIDTMQGDTNPSYILMGRFDNNPSGGVSYTGQPDSLVFYAKHNIISGDSAGVMLIFFNADTVTTMNLYWVDGNQATYKRYSFPISLSAPADSMLIAAVSSQFFAGKAFPGSTLYLDNMSFTGTVPQMANADFENWSEITYTEPQYWKTDNPSLIKSGLNQATKSTDAHSGSFALQAETIMIAYQNDTGTGPFNDTSTSSYISSLGYDENVGRDIGYPYDVKSPISIEGWYKYTAIGIDTAFISVGFINNAGFDIGGAGGSLLPTSVYTKFSFMCTPGLNPDSMRLNLTSGKNNGSTLIIDDIVIIDSCSSLTMDIGSDTALCGVSAITFTADAGFDSYVWNGSSTDTNQTFSYSLSGNVSVVATNTNNCMFTDTALVNYCPSARGLFKDLDVNIFPNPTTDIINVSINNFNSDEYFIELNDITGRVLNQFKLIQNNTSINTANYDNGIYLLNIKDSKGVTLSTNKIVLNK